MAVYHHEFSGIMIVESGIYKGSLSKRYGKKIKPSIAATSFSSTIFVISPAALLSYDTPNQHLFMFKSLFLLTIKLFLLIKIYRQYDRHV